MYKEENKEKLSLCQNNINKILEMAECNLKSTYEYSQVILALKNDSAKVIMVDKGVPDIYLSQEDCSESKFKAEGVFFKTIGQIKEVLAEYGCKIETNYDVSYVYIHDAYGNRKKI